ncbi:glycosyltransferase [Patescibacteria group bacterium]|nr:MAG: glycosyltransferase [Patescibacteria group bacterium]
MNWKHFIVIPAYNEEKRIEKTVKNYAEYFSDKAKILIVLNGCKDRSSGIVRELAGKYKDIDFIEFSEAIGKGAAVQEGFRHILKNDSSFKIHASSLIGFVDADEATSPEEYERLAGLIGEADGVIGSRFLKGAEVFGRSVLRGLVGNGFHLIVKILFNLPYKDTQCGVKIFKAEALGKILPELKVSNMAFDVEMLAIALKRGVKIKEIPTIWNGQPESGALGSPISLFKNGWKMFWTLVELKMRK